MYNSTDKINICVNMHKRELCSTVPAYYLLTKSIPEQNMLFASGGPQLTYLRSC